ncbi:MAG: N-acetylneuraminate synthase family protein [Planctomycetes bacterium]|nr:N-acetylneuraminate synthase family protein [Planctomycetota bacterium]
MTRIVAEVAQGYEGKPDYCALYVRAAARSGADAVKFQVVYADDVAEPGYRYYDSYKTLEMDLGVWREIRVLCDKERIHLFLDVSGERAMHVAREVRPDAIKFHASNFFNRRLLREGFAVAELVFVSVGGIEDSEIEELVREVESWQAPGQLALLCGFQAEPTPVESSRVSRLTALRARFPGIQVGYMDHAPGDSEDRVHVSLLAMALGADWIEKHLTLSRFLEIEDWVSALEPDEFARYVATLRRMEAALVDPGLGEEERSYRDRNVKKLLAARDLAVGHPIALGDLAFRRTPRIPAFAGFHDPARIVGRSLRRSLAPGDPVLEDDLA